MSDSEKAKHGLFGGSKGLEDYDNPAPTPPDLNRMRAELKEMEEDIRKELFRLETTFGVSVSGLYLKNDGFRGALGALEERYGVAATVRLDPDGKRVRITCEVTTD